MARIWSLISASALLSIFVASQYIPTTTAAVFQVVISTGENHKGTVGGATLAIQSEVAGTVLTLDTDTANIVANKPTTFRTSSPGLSGDVCFMQLQYTGGSAPEWSVSTVSVTIVESNKTVTFQVNKSVKITEALTVDTCKTRQES